MNTQVIVFVVSAIVLAIAAFRFLRSFVRQRGARLVACPETQQPAAVEANALRVAWSSLLGRKSMRLRECSRWPEREGCGQECLGAVAAAPDGCLVRSMLARWYDGKTCVLCGSEFEPLHWYSHEPALLNPRGRTLEWKDIPVVELQTVLGIHRPVCWNCHVIESVIREHPERVVFRP